MSKTENTTLSLLQSFESLGVFVANGVQPDKIELAPGVDAEFFVRELPDSEFRKLWADGDRAKLIAATICDDTGKPIMDAVKAGQLKPVLAAKFQAIALKHSGFGDVEGIKEEAGNA